MGVMVEGKWHKEGWPRDENGNFQREKTTFRSKISVSGTTTFFPESGRYHLYISWACPWASRTVIMRALKGLEDAISLSVVDPYMSEEGWEFSEREGCIPDTVNDAQYLREVYQKADSEYTGRVTVPVLWDKKKETIVNNESLEIMRFLDTEFDKLATNDVDLYPGEYRERIDEVIEEIYQPINNGVYRAGFASTQEAYETAVKELFEALDRWEGVLAEQRYLCGPVLTEADICMFTTLYRFDAVYYSHFKCNLRRIVDYPNLWNYLLELYQLPGVAAVCNMEHVKEHYYRSHEDINPHRIIPVGPELDFEQTHNRKSLEGSSPLGT